MAEDKEIFVQVKGSVDDLIAELKRLKSEYPNGEIIIADCGSFNEPWPRLIFMP